MSTGQLVVCAPSKVERPSCSVMLASDWMAISGQRKSFQLHSSVMMPTVASGAAIERQQRP